MRGLKSKGPPKSFLPSGDRFVDTLGRTMQLRGVNLSGRRRLQSRRRRVEKEPWEHTTLVGSCKFPMEPNGASHLKVCVARCNMNCHPISLDLQKTKSIIDHQEALFDTETVSFVGKLSIAPLSPFQAHQTGWFQDSQEEISSRFHSGLTS